MVSVVSPSPILVQKVYLHNDVINRDMDQFHKKANESHYSKSYCCCHGNLLEFFSIRFGTSFNQTNWVLHKLPTWLNKLHYLIHDAQDRSNFQNCRDWQNQDPDSEKLSAQFQGLDTSSKETYIFYRTSYYLTEKSSKLSFETHWSEGDWGLFITCILLHL